VTAENTVVPVRTGGSFCRVVDKYAPGLFLEVLAFWFVLRRLLPGRLILILGRLLVLMMVVGALGTLDRHLYVWAASFAGAAVLAWMLLRRWRGLPPGGDRRARVPILLAWRGKSPAEVASLCERRIGLLVDAAAPARVAGDPRTRCVLALAGDGLWVLEDQCRLRRPRVGRVLACWDRATLVSHVEHSRRGQRFEFSWPRQGALIRGEMPSGDPADLFAGYLAADELRPVAAATG
jgi:hypothetical protein